LALAALIVPLLLGLIVRHAAVQASGCWKAEITEQWTNLELAGSVLRVSVEGRGGLPVILRSLGGFETISVTGTKPEYGPSVAEFAPLSRGTYFIEPQGLGIVFEVWLDGQGYTRVDFTPTACAEPAAPEAQPATATSAPPPAATSQPAPTATPVPPAAPPPAAQPQPAASWQGRIAQHLPNPDGSVHWATIAVRVIGRPAGQPVEIYADPWSAVEKTGTKPEHGPDACEFGALNAGTYRLVATDLGASLDVAVERGDFVLVEFYQSGGAAVSSYWVGSVVENTSGSEPTEHANSAIAIIVSGKLWYDVEIQTDGWSSTAQTGYKPEYGPDACEFGGLRAATYTIIPKDLGVSAQVTVDGWGWAMVRFDEVVAHAPQPTAPPASEASQPEAEPTATATTPPDQPSPEASAPAAEPRWQGWVASNTSGEQEGTGIWSVVVVRVLNWAGVPVTITGGGGWSATCTTGTKPEYGPDACEFGGLWPGTYYLQPEGADIRVEVEMDGLGTAFVEFAAP
jgi:hypothetical protein